MPVRSFLLILQLVVVRLALLVCRASAVLDTLRPESQGVQNGMFLSRPQVLPALRRLYPSNPCFRSRNNAGIGRPEVG